MNVFLPGILLGWMLWAASLQAQTGSVVTVNADKVLTINGRKVFPIGFSPGPPNNGKTPSGADALQELRDAGGLIFRITQTTDWNSQVIADQQAALDWAAQHGMYCWVNLRELSKFAAGDTATPAALRNLVDTFRNHPALGIWKNFDEAWWGGVSEADLQRGYEVIKQEDANHPVVQTHAPRGTVSDLQPYNAAADILALDIYPVGYPPGTHSLLTNKEISMVGDWAAFLGQVANNQRPYWLIEQIAWSGVTPPSKTLRYPSFAQERYMAYQAIIRGARGLMFFGGNIAACLNAQDAPLGWNWTFWNEVLKRLVLEIGDHGQIADALAAPASSLPVTVTGASSPDVEFCVREVPPYVYLFACKREGSTIQVAFNGLPSNAAIGDVLYESPRIVTATNGTFTDWFAPFDVHVYRFLLTNTPAAPANQLIFYEPFNYQNIGGQVSTNAPGSWAFNGSGGNDLNVAAGSLSYPELPISVGNSVTNGGPGLGARRLFGSTISTGAVYFSALFRINDLGEGIWNGAAAQVGALTATDNQTFRLAVLVKSSSPGAYIFGLQKGGTGATSTFSSTEYHAGDIVFLVGKYNFSSSPNAVSLWINPPASTFGQTNDPAGPLSISTGTDGFVIDRFNFRQNTAASVPASIQWDELRISSRWSDVAPAPAAFSVTLTDVKKLPNGPLQFAFASGGLQGYGVYASSNLVNWSPIGSAVPVGAGLYQFNDPSVSNSPRRFYQLRAP